VSTNWIAGEHDLSEHHARHITHRPDFPKPVVKLSGRRAWLKTDVEAYFDVRPFPKRKEYALQDEYLSAAELAALMGKAERQFSQTTRIPEPAGLVSRNRYWRRSEVERWMRNERAQPRRARVAVASTRA